MLPIRCDFLCPQTTVTAVFGKIEPTEQLIKLLFLRSILSHGSTLLCTPVEVDHLDEAVKSLNRIANRLSLSIIVASLILGGKLVADTLGKTETRSNRKHRH